MQPFHYHHKKSSVFPRGFVFLTFSIPLMCIFAIISAVKRKVTMKSHENVKYCKNGSFSNVFGVFIDTDIKLTRAQNLISLLTHSCNQNINNTKNILKIHNRNPHLDIESSNHRRPHKNRTLLTHSMSALSLSDSSGP